MAQVAYLTHDVPKLHIRARRRLTGYGPMDGAAVQRAVAVCRGVLGPAADQDWTRQAANVDWSVARTVAHIAESLLWYAADMAAGPAELSSMNMTVPADKPPAELLRTLRTFGVVLARVLDAAAPEDRGWHPFGLPDAGGFAASACNEILVHSADAAAGLDLAFEAPTDLVESVLHRMFPWAPTDTDPWQALLWANGRLDLPGRERQSGWRWHCAPLSEWDG